MPIVPIRYPASPESKFTPVKVTRLDAQWFGFAATAQRPTLPELDYFAIAPATGGHWRAELAHRTSPADWGALAEQLLAGGSGEAPANDIIAYHDTASGQYRYAAFSNGRCTGMLFLASSPVEVARTWAIAQVGVAINQAERVLLLAGRGGAGAVDKGPIVCACFEVGRNQIARAITDMNCTTIADIGGETGAGTNCGSCRAEIGRLIHDASNDAVDDVDHAQTD